MAGAEPLVCEDSSVNFFVFSTNKSNKTFKSRKQKFIKEAISDKDNVGIGKTIRSIKVYDKDVEKFRQRN